MSSDDESGNDPVSTISKSFFSAIPTLPDDALQLLHKAANQGDTNAVLLFRKQFSPMARYFQKKAHVFFFSKMLSKHISKTFLANLVAEWKIATKSKMTRPCPSGQLVAQLIAIVMFFQTSALYASQATENQDIDKISTTKVSKSTSTSSSLVITDLKSLWPDHESFVAWVTNPNMTTAIRLLDDPQQVASCPPIFACDTCGLLWHLKMCTGCQALSFCSKSCQKYAWKQGGHKNVCGGLNPNVIITIIACILVVLLWAAYIFFMLPKLYFNWSLS